MNPITLNKYLYANGDPILFVDPSGYFSLSNITASLRIQSIQKGSAQASFRVFIREIGEGLACVAIEELVSEVVMQSISSGIYILGDSDSGYVGRTNDFKRRMQEHARAAGNKTKNILAKFHLDGNRNEMRIIEQFFMDVFREVNQPLSNQINSIAPSPTSINSKKLRKIVDKIDFCK